MAARFIVNKGNKYLLAFGIFSYLQGDFPILNITEIVNTIIDKVTRLHNYYLRYLAARILNLPVTFTEINTVISKF